MTEEIIIDCINVSECKYLNKVVNEEPYCNIDEEHLYTCSSDENCYYKQLKRLEQENKELSFAIEKCLENAGIECDDEEQALRSLPMLGNAHYKVLIEKEALEQENRELRKKYSNLLSKNLDKQCIINNLQNKLATQEFSLKVNGKNAQV